MRRLFWTYPSGLPGAGLLVMRFVAGVTLLAPLFPAPPGTPPPEAGGLQMVLLAVPGALLIGGLWTALAAALLAAAEVWRSYADPATRLAHVLMGTIGAALVLLGPGAWSADAYLFGWKRIDIRDRRRDSHLP
ncbi:MAG: hypothetical protein ABIX28_11545 [Vicinamibacterales bacterium]